MSNRAHAFVVAAASLLFTLTATAAKVGNKAPEFSLTDVNGKEHTLSDYRGKIVVLEWINHGCPYVSKHYDSRNMQTLQADLTGKDIVWLSICSSAPGKQGHMSNRKWQSAIRSKGMNSSAVLVDESGEVGRAYGARTTPHMFVIDDKGVLAYEGAIDSVRSVDPADIARAKNYVISAVEALIKGDEVSPSVTKPYGCSIKYATRDL